MKRNTRNVRNTRKLNCHKKAKNALKLAFKVRRNPDYMFRKSKFTKKHQKQLVNSYEKECIKSS